MKYLLYFFIAALGYVVFWYVNFRIVLTQSTNPIIIQTDRSLGKGPTLKYLAAGDSTAQGTGASIMENTYPFKIAEFLANKNSVEYKNIGVSGARIEDVIAKQLPQIIKYQPDIITISIGGNDIDRLASKEYVLWGFNQIIAELSTKTSAKIYLANLPNFNGAELLPRPYIWLIEKRSGPINQALVSLETERVKIANVHDFFGNETDIASTYSNDQFHPSDIGYKLWTKAFLEKIK